MCQCQPKSEGNEQQSDVFSSEICKHLCDQETTKNVSIYFENYGHFLQKSKAFLLSKIIKTLFQLENEKRQN